MKKLAISGLLGLVLLSACGDSNVGASLGRLEAIGKDNVGTRDSITIFRDKETGCQYMTTDAVNGAVIVPVLNQDGKPYCPQK